MLACAESNFSDFKFEYLHENEFLSGAQMGWVRFMKKNKGHCPFNLAPPPPIAYITLLYRIFCDFVPYASWSSDPLEFLQYLSCQHIAIFEFSFLTLHLYLVKFYFAEYSFYPPELRFVGIFKISSVFEL